MHEALWLALDLALVLAASCLGFACLALSMPRHWRDVTGEVALPAGRVTALRALGYLALAGSLALTLLRDGVSFGSVLWVLVLTAGAATVTFTLTWRPAWLRQAVRVVRVSRKAGCRERPTA